MPEVQESDLEAAAAAREKKRVRQREAQKRYRLRHPERCKESMRKSRLRHAESIKERRREYCREHAEEISARQRRWREKNPGYGHRHYIEHREAYRAQGLRYRTENAETIRERSIAGAYKNRVTGSPRVSFGPADWKWLLERYGNACAYCGQPFGPGRRACRDHVIPVQRGGAHTINNIVPTCYTCNNHKSCSPISPFGLDQDGRAHFGLIHTSGHINPQVLFDWK